MGSGYDIYIDCVSRFLLVPLGYETTQLRWYNVCLSSVDVVTSTLAIGVSTRCREADTISIWHRPVELAGGTLDGFG